MVPKRWVPVVVFLFAACSCACFSQKNVEHQRLLWVRYSLKLNLNENYQLTQDLEERTYYSPWRQHQWVSRTQLDRNLGKGWNAGLGFAFFNQSVPQEADKPIAAHLLELRPHLELSYKQQLTPQILLHHRYWNEFRFYESPEGSHAYGNMRLRYKIELRYSPWSKCTFKAFDEIHLNVGDQIVYNFFDQNRIGGSCQYLPSKNYGFELGYINWFQQQKSGVDFYSRDILRLTFLHQIPLKKQQL